MFCPEEQLNKNLIDEKNFHNVKNVEGESNIDKAISTYFYNLQAKILFENYPDFPQRLSEIYIIYYEVLLKNKACSMVRLQSAVEQVYSTKTKVFSTQGY